MTKTSYSRPVYIVDGLRSPLLKARGVPGPFSASDLAVQAGRMLLARQSFLPTDLDEVVAGCIMPSADETNIARVIALRLGCGFDVPAYTVQRNCGSGLQALDNAALDIASGRCNLVLAGGTEAMSHAPLLFNRSMVIWLAKWMGAKSFGTKFKTALQFRPAFLAPVIGLIRGLTDPIVNLSMGQTAEKVAYHFGITRSQMDEFAWESHQRLAHAQDQGWFKDEVTTIYDGKGNYYDADDGVRRETTLQKLGQLKPFFDKPFGSVTAGNSSQITDGATFLILASEEAVKKYELPVIGRLTETAWSGLDPSEMGLGPAFACAALLKKTGLSLKEIDYWEINEAFAAQVLACLKAWEDPAFCKQYLDLDKPLGTVDRSHLNVDGGAIAIGHPVGMSGARLVLHLLHVLKRKKAKRGIASMCIGGGQGGAALVEAL